jgi:hypothetical protein
MSAQFMTSRIQVVALGLLAAASLAASAADQRSAPDLSGFWQVTAGSWTVPHTAKLTPKALAYEKHSAEERAQGKVVGYYSRWCIGLGMPFLMGQSPPIDIVQGPGVVGIYAEQLSMARYIYLDGRPHPDQRTYALTTNGHSTGHWEHDELVVDTVGFSSVGATGVPGGGYRTPSSHLTERFKLSEDGQTLSISNVWEDPAVYTEPHSYTQTYHRLPADSYAYEDICDASDAKPYESSGGVSDTPLTDDGVQP